MRYLILVVVFIQLSGNSAVAQSSGSSVWSGQILGITFDDTEDINLFGAGDGWIHTADSSALKSIKQGNHIKEVKIAKGAGHRGDALHFTAKTKQVLLYKVTGNDFHPVANWAGTVSVWLKVDPSNLPAGFCDPVQITAKKWNDASFFIDFDKDRPRDFRLGVFSNYKFWNPTDTKFEEIPLAQRPMITVKKPPFASDQWTHVVFTFANINSGSPSVVNLYLNGELQGSLHRPLEFTWVKTKERPDAGVMLLGINYVGYMDELNLWNRALTPGEVRKLFHLPPEGS